MAPLGEEVASPAREASACLGGLERMRAVAVFAASWYDYIGPLLSSSICVTAYL